MRWGYMQYDLDMIKEELLTLPEYDNQVYLQGSYLDMDPISPTIDQNYLHVDSNEAEYSINLFDTLPYINSIMDEHKLLRTRVMKMKPRTCYYWHFDNTKRLHIPIVTNPHCFLLIDGTQIHLPATGEAYIMDTTKPHTALNASKEDRIHIVGAFGAFVFHQSV